MNKPARRSGIGDRQRMLDVLEQFRIIVKSIRRHYQDVERRAGISGAQLWALAQIAGQPGCQVGELARALAVHPSTASNLVRELEARELVREAALTGEGHATAARLIDARFECLHSLVADWEPDSDPRVNEAIDRLARELARETPVAAA
jgi:DNA-binding MarR family transcriptional regulator